MECGFLCSLNETCSAISVSQNRNCSLFNIESTVYVQANSMKVNIIRERAPSLGKGKICVSNQWCHTASLSIVPHVLVITNSAFDWSPQPVASPVIPVSFNAGGNGHFLFNVQERYYACGGTQGGTIFDDCNNLTITKLGQMSWFLCLLPRFQEGSSLAPLSKSRRASSGY